MYNNQLLSMEQALKLLGNETVKFLMKHLQNEGLLIESHCLGQNHACDIIAVKPDKKLLVELKRS
jgi:hypothetical protein